MRDIRITRRNLMAGAAAFENGEAFTAIYDEELDTGYVFRGQTDGEARFEGVGPHAVSWSGEALAPLNSFEAMWFAWAAFYPETAVHE